MSNAVHRRALRYNPRVDWPTAIAIVSLAASAALIQALSGFGFSLFIVPFLALLIGPRDTVLLANLMSTFGSGMQARNLRHSADRRTAGILLIGAVVGMPFGLAVLLLLDPQVLQIAIAVSVIVFTLVIMRGLALHKVGTAGDLMAGIASGILNTSTSMSGPPVVLYLQGKKFPPLQFRATITTYFAITSAIGVVLLLATGNAKPYVFVAFVLSVPAIFFGQRLGNALFEKVTVDFFRRMVFGILFLSAAAAIVGAVRG
jgi:uncharacterized membrane protein YfcA